MRIHQGFDRLTHYIFRYPAKFHPPVVRALLDAYTREGDVVLDPFCGSGTLMVEAAVRGRQSVGLDIDPVAVRVARIKTHRFGMRELRSTAAELLEQLDLHRRPAEEYAARMFRDLDMDEYDRQLDDLHDAVPAIPNLFHWFRRYVIIDLARIARTIAECNAAHAHRSLFEVVFASILRTVSNADPVPVSGLEVTSHMQKRDAAGRLIDPFQSFASALTKTLAACESFCDHTVPPVCAVAKFGDATQLDRKLSNPVDAVITSPPYHGAVDYYRRHQLEMFWLGATRTVAERRALLDRYVGRPKVPQRHPYVRDETLTTDLASRWERRIRRVSHERADAFRHYIVAMTRFFGGLAPYLHPGAPAVLVVGHSTWNKSKIPTTALFREIAGRQYELEDVLWYPVKNRYMSYKRRNGASIDKEYVLVFRRTDAD